MSRGTGGVTHLPVEFIVLLAARGGQRCNWRGYGVRKVVRGWRGAIQAQYKATLACKPGTGLLELWASRALQPRGEALRARARVEYAPAAGVGTGLGLRAGWARVGGAGRSPYRSSSPYKSSSAMLSLDSRRTPLQLEPIRPRRAGAAQLAQFLRLFLSLTRPRSCRTDTQSAEARDVCALPPSYDKNALQAQLPPSPA